MFIRTYDLETTGLDPSHDQVVELACCDLFYATRRISPPKSTLIHAFHVPPESSAIHHLLAEDLQFAPSFEKAWPDYAPGEAIAAAAHNADFEESFLGAYMPETEWICTYKCALRLWPQAPGHGNQVLRYWLGDRFLGGRNCGDPHRAGPDAYVTAHILLAMLEEADLDQLMAWSKEPPLLPYPNFGKYKGQSWEDVPTDYLEWMLRQTDMSEGRRHTAQLHLNKRREQRDATS